MQIENFPIIFHILIANQNKAIFATEIICITKVKTMKEIREKINSIDDRMLKLLAERRQLSVEIIKFKNEEKSSIRDKEREKQVLTRLLEVGREYGLDTHYVTKIFQEIINDSIKIQNKFVIDSTNLKDDSETLKVAIQGIEGSYSFLATNQFFSDSGKDINFKKFDTFDEVVESVEDSTCDYAILPIENTTSGSINDVYDALTNSSLQIVGEEIFPVKHCLITTEDVPLKQH
jgi:chorismate mutase/prephenate dehydratase